MICSIIIHSIQFIYLLANLTALRPVAKQARVGKTNTYIQTKNKSQALLVIIIIKIIIPLTQKPKVNYMHL
jgi:hypothetical protein